MKAWMTLYAMIWIALVEFLLAMTPSLPYWLLVVHGALGFGIVALAFTNYNAVRGTRVPGRVKRTARSTMQLSLGIAALGLLLFWHFGSAWSFAGVTVEGLVLFVHVLLAFAVITQAAAVAIAFDMWEEKEFAAETAPGDVPAMPVPARPSSQRPQV